MKPVIFPLTDDPALQELPARERVIGRANHRALDRLAGQFSARTARVASAA